MTRVSQVPRIAVSGEAYDCRRPRLFEGDVIAPPSSWVGERRKHWCCLVVGVVDGWERRRLTFWGVSAGKEGRGTYCVLSCRGREGDGQGRFSPQPLTRQLTLCLRRRLAMLDRRCPEGPSSLPHPSPASLPHSLCKKASSSPSFSAVARNWVSPSLPSSLFPPPPPPFTLAGGIGPSSSPPAEPGEDCQMAALLPPALFSSAL